MIVGQFPERPSLYDSAARATRVEGGRDGWAFGNPSSYVVTGAPLTDIQADC